MHPSAPRAELDKISELVDLRLSSEGKRARPELDEKITDQELRKHISWFAHQSGWWTNRPIVQSLQSVGHSARYIMTTKSFYLPVKNSTRLWSLRNWHYQRTRENGLVLTWMMEKITDKKLRKEIWN